MLLSFDGFGVASSLDERRFHVAERVAIIVEHSSGRCSTRSGCGAGRSVRDSVIWMERAATSIRRQYFQASQRMSDPQI